MADQENNNGQPNDKGGSGGQPNDKGGDVMIPKSRFDEVIGQRNDANTRIGTLEKTIAELQTKNKEKADQDLAEQGKYKELTEKQKAEIESLKSTGVKLTTYAERLSAINAEKRKSIPENLRDIIPTFNDPMDEFDYLVKFESKLPEISGKGPAGPAPVGGKPGGTQPGADDIANLEKELGTLAGKNDVLSGARRVNIMNQIHNLKQQKR